MTTLYWDFKWDWCHFKHVLYRRASSASEEAIKKIWFSQFSRLQVSGCEKSVWKSIFLWKAFRVQWKVLVVKSVWIILDTHERYLHLITQESPMRLITPPDHRTLTVFPNFSNHTLKECIIFLIKTLKYDWTRKQQQKNNN